MSTELWEILESCGHEYRTVENFRELWA